MENDLDPRLGGAASGTRVSRRSSDYWAGILRFCGITLVCAITGTVIGAADGAATLVSTILYRNPIYTGFDMLETMAVWAIGGSGVGAIIGAVVGVALFYAVFGARASLNEFAKISAISLRGGVAVCLATGNSVIELSWLRRRSSRLPHHSC